MDDFSLWEHCNNLYKQSYGPGDKLDNFWSFYNGDFENSTEAKGLNNVCNVIKQVVDTKATLALDAMMTTTVIPELVSFRDFQNLKDAEATADLLNDCLTHVLKSNKWTSKKAEIMDDGEIFGFGGVEVVWSDSEKAVGDVGINLLDARNLRWEKSARAVKDSSYFFIKFESSIFELKKKYGLNSDGTTNVEALEKIDRLSGQVSKKTDSLKEPKGIISYDSLAGGGQAYSYGGGDTFSKTTGKTVKLLRCYLKDDSTFIEDETDSEGIKTGKVLERMKYPHGRLVIMSSDEKNKIIFDDKPIDYPFGLPIFLFNAKKNKSIEGKSEVEDLIIIQRRINKTYDKAQLLIAKFISTVCYDSQQLDLTDDDFIDTWALKIENMRQNGIPQVLTNNTLSELNSLRDYVLDLKNEAKAIARINDIMIAGNTPSEIKSGVAIEALKESPQASIRAVQRNFQEFIIDVSNACVSLIQKYYNVNRIVSLSEGYAEIVPNAEDNKIKVNFLDKDGNPVINDDVVKQITDLSAGQYIVDVVAGTEVPRSRAEHASLIERLYRAGDLGDMSDLDIKEQYFRALDLPNYRAFIQILKKKRDEDLKSPPMPPQIEKFTASLKDLPLEALVEILNANGFNLPAQQPEGGMVNNENSM